MVWDFSKFEIKPREWEEEPDEEFFEYHGYQCEILRNDVGVLSGCVLLPLNHKYFGKHYDDIPLECHGGLTYADATNSIKEWRIGFDCGQNIEYVRNEIKNLVHQLEK